MHNRSGSGPRASVALHAHPTYTQVGTNVTSSTFNNLYQQSFKKVDINFGHPQPCLHITLSVIRNLKTVNKDLQYSHTNKFTHHQFR
jgi:hypothetical protein